MRAGTALAVAVAIAVAVGFALHSEKQSPQQEQTHLSKQPTSEPPRSGSVPSPNTTSLLDAPAPSFPAEKSVSSIPPSSPSATGASTAHGFSTPPPLVEPPRLANRPTAPRSADDAAVESDLLQVELMIRNFRDAVGENPIGTNAEIMAAVLGDNIKQARIGTSENQRLNEKWRVDRPMGYALFFPSALEDPDGDPTVQSRQGDVDRRRQAAVNFEWQQQTAAFPRGISRRRSYGRRWRRR
jgi:hypothetical protein